MNPVNSNNQDTVNLYDYWMVIVRRRKMIAWAGALAFVISVVISLLIPKSYVSTTSVMPPQQESSINGALGSAVPGSLTGLASSFIGESSTTDLWVGVLRSRTVKDGIIERFKLREEYGKSTLEDTRKTLDKKVSIELSDEDIVSVSVEDRDPGRASEIANAFIEELDRMNKTVVMTSGQRMRAFAEKRLAEAKAELSKTEEALRGFQEKNKAVQLDAQSQAIIESAGILKGQLMAKEVALETLLSYAAPTHPQVDLLRSEIKGLQVRLREIETGRPGRRDIFMPTDTIPELSFQYARLLRDAKIQETLFDLLTQQYEMARMQEAKDSPTVQVLDIAKPPDKKARPKRALMVALSTFSALSFAVFFAFFREYLEKMRGQARS